MCNRQTGDQLCLCQAGHYQDSRTRVCKSMSRSLFSFKLCFWSEYVVLVLFVLIKGKPCIVYYNGGGVNFSWLNPNKNLTLKEGGCGNDATSTQYLNKVVFLGLNSQ